MRNIPLFKPYIAPREELMPALEETLYSGYIAQGKKVEEFEEKFGAYIGNPNVVAVSSCTAALHLALVLAGVGPGDEVISTPMTAEPTNMAILYTGAKIVWADVDRHTGNIDPASVRDKITDKTKAIMVVHYGGVPADMRKLSGAKFWHNIPVIEDCAHALGATWGKRYTWGMGVASEYACFSFQAIKHLTTVEGGVLVVGDPAKLSKARKLRWFGIDRKVKRTNVNVAEMGWKYNFNDVSATMGIVQLIYMREVVSRHQVNGEWLWRRLENVDGLDFASTYDGMPSYWFFTLHTKRRNHLMKYLQDHGIGCGTVHKRNDEHSVFFQSANKLLSFDSGLAKFCSTALHIPCGWWVTEEDREYIAEKIEEGLKT